jgi:hypothetical protein
MSQLTQEVVIFTLERIDQKENHYKIAINMLPRMTPLKPTEVLDFMAKCRFTDRQYMYDFFCNYWKLPTTPTVSFKEYMDLMTPFFSDGVTLPSYTPVKITPIARWNDLFLILKNYSIYRTSGNTIIKVISEVMKGQEQPTPDIILYFFSWCSKKAHRFDVLDLFLENMTPIKSFDVYQKFLAIFASNGFDHVEQERVPKLVLALADKFKMETGGAKDEKKS